MLLPIHPSLRAALFLAISQKMNKGLKRKNPCEKSAIRVILHQLQKRMSETFYWFLLRQKSFFEK